MPDEVKEVQAPMPKPKPPKPEEAVAPLPEPKIKVEKVKVKLIGAASCNYEGIVLRKNETVELETSRAEQLMQSGLFERL